MSCEANLAGLFWPKASETWNPYLPWQPIPVHIANPDVFNDFPNCSSYIAETKYILQNDPFYRAVNAKMSKTFDYVSANSGENISMMGLSVSTLYDTLHVEELFGLKLPEWTKSVYPQPLAFLAELGFTAYAPTKRLRRLCKYFIL